MGFLHFECKIPRIRSSVDVCHPAPLTHQHLCTHRLAPGWPKGSSEVLRTSTRQQTEQVAAEDCSNVPSPLKLHSFEVLGQDFLIFGNLAKATAATPLCQMCENPTAIAKVFIFHQDKICRRKKWAHVRKHRHVRSLTCSAEPRLQISSPDGYQTG